MNILRLAIRSSFTLAACVSLVHPLAARAASRNAVGPALTVDGSITQHLISNDVYGVTIFWNASASNYAALRTFAQQIGLPANRYGGDGTTRYNWNVDSSNPGSDFFFTAGNGEANPVPSASVDAIVAINRALKTKSIITVPIIDDINNAAAYHCSYPQSVYPNQQAYNPYVHPNGDNCGNGVSAASGQYIADTNISASDIPNQPNIQQAWVRHFAGAFGTGAQGGVGIYELDNEPNGWIAVHHDVRPQNIGYTDLTTRSVAYATAIKTADPTALVLGPGDISPADENCNSGGQPGTCNNDQASNHGGTPLGLFYLQQFAAQKTRLLDYYAMHYPGSCCFSTNGTLADMVTAIHRHQGWIAQAYPGTKLAYDEWNRGTGNGFANALATADGLGVMGREGVDLASFWGLNDPSYPSAFAFQIFRNYDGHGSAFGNVSATATTADPTSLTIYAARRSLDGALTVLVVNQTATNLSTSLGISNLNGHGNVHVYEYTQANPAAIVAAPSLRLSHSIAVTFPAQSLTMLVIL
jgi:hypothetical protein